MRWPARCHSLSSANKLRSTSWTCLWLDSLTMSSRHHRDNSVQVAKCLIPKADIFWQTRSCVLVQSMSACCEGAWRAKNLYVGRLKENTKIKRVHKLTWQGKDVHSAGWHNLRSSTDKFHALNAWEARSYIPTHRTCRSHCYSTLYALEPEFSVFYPIRQSKLFSTQHLADLAPV